MRSAGKVWNACVVGQILSLLSTSIALPVWAEEGAKDEHATLLENFPPAELAAIGLLVGANTALFAIEEPLAEAGGYRAFGAPPGFDRSVSDALYQGPDYKMLGGSVDIAGLASPALALAFYGLDASVFWIRGRALTSETNPDHKLLAFVEALGTTFLLTQTSKIFLGRERPLYALGHPSEPPDVDADMSFFSMHTSAAFCVAAFVTRDVSDWWIREHGGVPWVARLVPGTFFYGSAAVVGLSRVMEQEHYASDVLAATVVGAAAGNIFYALHFDDLGRPRRGQPSQDSVEVRLSPFPGGISVAGRF